MAQASPEIRFRIDSIERAQFERIAEQVGMNSNDMVRVFIKRSIAAGGFPFEMRTPLPEGGASIDRAVPVHGVPLAHLADVATRAARSAHAGHLEAGRLEPFAPDSAVR
jgi:antitoxin component of RelBE/YafQ-DinJ toxin-antitoxin module